MLAGYHSHICPHDGTQWIHSDEKAGDVREHTCPTCGRVLPVTLQAPGTKVEGAEESKVWTKGWAKATVIMPSGEERKVVSPKSSVGSPEIGAYLMVFGIAVIAAVCVYYSAPLLEKYFAQGAE